MNAAPHLVYGDRVFSSMHQAYVRVLRVELDGMVAVLCNETGKELPDLCHPTQLRPLQLRARAS